MTDAGFDIKHQELDNCDLFILSGRIDGATAPAFELAMRRALDLGHYKIVLNLKDVTYMSSVGLRILISTSKTCRKHRNGDLRLAEVSPRVREVMELAGLIDLFQVFDSESEAIASFS